MLLDKPAGQIIQQFRMARPISHQAEIDCGAHNAGAEVMLPDAIHHHAGSQRILRICYRFRQFQPSASVAESNRLALAQNAEKVPRYRIAEVVGISAQSLLQIRGIVHIRDDVQEGISLRQRLLSGFQLGAHAVDAGLCLAGQEAVDVLIVVVEDSGIILQRALLGSEQIGPEDELVALHACG